MKLGKLIQSLGITGLLVSTVVKAGAFIPSEVSAPSENGVEISLNLPSAPREGGITTGTVGGGRRSPNSLCTNQSQPPLTVLMSHEVNHIEVGENSRQRDNIAVYWYLPETNAQKAEFLIVSKNGKYIYFQEFDIPQNTKGLVRLDLPNNIPFEEDTVYKWELALVCQEFDRSSDEYVWGAIQPLNANQETELTNEVELARMNPSVESATSPEEAIANVYIRHNLWHKAVELFLEPSSSTVVSGVETSEPLAEILEYFSLDQETNLIGIINQNGFRPIE